VYNIPTACNRVTADFLISSPLIATPYDRCLVDYQTRMSTSAEPTPPDATPSSSR
jgi:methylglyoxal synthase